MTRICREAEASLDYYAMFKNILKQVRPQFFGVVQVVFKWCKDAS
jgi:hypothetical protein